MPSLIKIILLAVITILAIYAGTRLATYQDLGLVSMNHILLTVLAIIWFALVYFLLRDNEDAADAADDDDE
jgi:hypothetical protein